jgi:hypothetical protein
MNEEMRTEDLFWVELKIPKKKHKSVKYLLLFYFFFDYFVWM